MALINIGASPNDGTGDNLRTAGEKINSVHDDNVVLVKQESDFLPISSTKVYKIFAGEVVITNPLIYSGNLTIIGSSFSKSILRSDIVTGSLFNSSDSGNLYLRDFTITGNNNVNQSIFSIDADTGFEAIEILSVNFIECYNLGYFNGFRQGYESGTARFDFDPQLEFRGAWLGGYVINDSIVRGMDANLPTLFKAGAGLTFGSRFKTNINADVPSGMSLFDFSSSNFIKSDLLQIQNAIITRDGIFNPDDTTLYPNINEKNLKSNWKDNTGLPNTKKGAVQNVTTQAATTLTQNTWVNVAGTFTLSKAQHFDSPTNGRLRNNSDIPIDVVLAGNILAQGGANDVIEVRAVILRNATGLDEIQEVSRFTISSNLGANNLGSTSVNDYFTMKPLDVLRLQIRNTTSNTAVTIQTGSKYRILS